MADHESGTHKHSASDRALDKLATSEQEEASAKQGKQGHDPSEIRKHDDAGKDRLFEGREQHDEGEKNSEKNRLARDVDRHHHPVDEDVADSGSGPSAKGKN